MEHTSLGQQRVLCLHGLIMTALVAFLQALRWAFGCASWFTWSCCGAMAGLGLGLGMMTLYTTWA